MAITSTSSGVSYAGNESTSTPYPIPFRFLDSAHIYACTLAAGGTEGEDEMLLSAADYTVTQHDDGTGELVTAQAIASSTTLTIFREVPVTQPAVYETGGAFAAKSHETALDRIVMILQQHQRKINALMGHAGWAGTPVNDGSTIVVPGSLPEVLRDVLYFTDAADRAASAASRVGQLATQLDDSSLWISLSTTAGDWLLLEDPTPPVLAERITLAVAGDVGVQTADQQALADFIASWSPAADAVILAGDVSYNGESELDDDWAAWDFWTAAETLLVVPGNHDIDGATKWDGMIAKTPYLDWASRQWHQSFGNGLVEVFGLHSGRDSAWVLQEPDGNAVGSAQHARFVAWLAASTARWKMVVFHHPPTSTEEAAAANNHGHEPAMDWPEFSQVDAIICGHAHLTEVINFKGIPVINCSGSVKQDGDSTLLLADSPPHSSLLYANGHRRLCGRITATPTRLLLELVDQHGLAYIRDLSDLSQDGSQWGAEVLPPDASAAAGTFHVGVAPVGMAITEYFVAVASTGSTALSGRILVNAVQACRFTIPAGDFWSLSLPESGVDAAPVLPLGAIVEVEITAADSYPAHRGLTVYARGRTVQ